MNVTLRGNGGAGVKSCVRCDIGNRSPNLSLQINSCLIYRYTREITGGARPALRLITTHDASASWPMILCVSNILPSKIEGEIPDLEVTDGWYRLRAQIDDALARAVKKGAIRIGRKIAVTYCRVCS